MATNTMDEMVAAVKKHARAHYNDDGWDSIVECYHDSELAREITEGGCKTIDEAIAHVGWGCKVWNDRRKDVIAESF